MTKGIFIGRFQPMHQGHLEVLTKAANSVSTLYILVGSANACRSIRNPWTFKERKEKITTTLYVNGITNFKIVPLNDYPYSDNQWVADVQETLESFDVQNPTVFGYYKDGNDYLKLFPFWKYVNVTSVFEGNATAIREEMYAQRNALMPQTVLEDFDYYAKESELFKNYPFPETLNFNCADALVECAGNVLLIKRKSAPGKNTWALPGGFRNNTDLTFLDCAIRELLEETNLRIPEKVLRGSIVKTELFDYIKRSYGIPRNTLAVHFRVNVNADGSLPRVSPKDDAIEACWFTLSEALNVLALYDDHKGIISKLTGVMPLPAFLVYK